MSSLASSACNHVFDSAASTYASSALIQKLVVTSLLGMVKLIGQGFLVLDLGCGSGFVGNSLPYDVVFQCDISSGMCSQAKQSNGHVTINCDMNALPFRKEQFDYVFSSMAIQWSTNFEHSIQEIYKVLKVKGRLFIAMPIQGTFCELEKAYSLLGIKRSFFLNLQQIINIIELLPLNYYTRCEKYMQSYPTFRDFVRHLKTTGTYKATDIQNSVNPFTIGKIYKKIHENAQGLPVTWNIAYIVAERTV